MSETTRDDLRALRDYVQHLPTCPLSLPQVKLELGPGWKGQSWTKPCTCGLFDLLARLDAASGEGEPILSLCVFREDDGRYGAEFESVNASGVTGYADSIHGAVLMALDVASTPAEQEPSR